jgi:hypothetical protein
MTSRTLHVPRERKQPNNLLTASRTTESTTTPPESSEATAPVERERRGAMIAEAAYYRAEQRGFEPGCELDDWCAAENDIDALLTRGEMPSTRG